MQYHIIRNFKQVDLKYWANFINSHEDGTFFQSPTMADFFYGIEEYSPFVIIAYDDHKMVHGVLLGILMKEKGIKAFFSRRCIIWGGPVTNDSEIAKQLLNHLNHYIKRQVIFTEFRNLSDLSRFNTAFKENGFLFNPHLNFIVPVENVEDPLSLLSSSKRRQVRKSLKSGAIITRASTEQQVKDFYWLLRKLYTVKVKKPLPSKDFFIRFWQKKIGEILLVEYEDKVIGGIVAPIYKGVIYEWYIAGEDGCYGNIYPSVLATWSAIDYASRNNLKYFNFMGAGKPNEDYGVREFKSKFGGMLVEHGRFIKINHKFLYLTGRLGLKILSSIK